MNFNEKYNLIKNLAKDEIKSIEENMVTSCSYMFFKPFTKYIFGTKMSRKIG